MEPTSRKNELLVGLFLIIGLALLGGLIIRFGAISDSFRETYPLTITFADASGITKGAPVRLGGATVGRVEEKPYLNDNFTGVVVSLGIYNGLDIPENSEFRVGSSGLMGDALIEIRPPKELTGKSILSGTQIDGTKTGGLAAITDSAQEVAAKTQVVLNDVQIAVQELTRAVDKVNDGFLTEKNMNSFSTSLETFGTALERLDTKILSEENAADVRETIADLKETGKNLKEGSAKIAPFIEKLDPVVADLRSAASKMESTFDALEKTATALETTAKDASATIRAFNEGEGLLPALLNDRNLKATFALLAANLKEHGILRYKDDAVLTTDGTVLNSDGRPTSQPTYTPPPPKRTLRSGGPLR